MATVADVFGELLGVRDIAEVAQVLVSKFLTFVGPMEDIVRTVGEAVVRVANSAPSRGYEPFFVAEGFDRIVARAMSRLLVRHGRRIEKEGRRRTRVVEAIAFLATPGRRKPAARRRASTVHDAWEHTSIIETFFDEHALGSEREFVELAGSVAGGEDDDFARLTEIAASIQGRLASVRGPKMSAATAAHAFLLEILPGLGISNGYTYSDVQGDFVDEKTRATRLEFTDPHFSPRTARRRMRRHAKPENGLRVRESH